MALEYALDIGAELEPQQVLELMFTRLSIEPHIYQSDNMGVIVSTAGSGFTTYSSILSDLQASLLKEELNIDCNIHIVFRLDKFEDRKIAKTNLLQLTIGLLQQTQGDAALLFNGEQPLFIRSSERLTLNKSTDFWTSYYSNIVTIPYEMKDIPVL